VMGLDVSHGCWHGAYSAFTRWRIKLAEVSGMPPLMLMEGFYDERASDLVSRTPTLWTDAPHPVLASLPIKWECLKPSPLHILLNHSDCDGEIAASDCGPLADTLAELIPLLPEGGSGGHIANWREKTQAFVDGLRLAAAAGESVEFR